MWNQPTIITPPSPIGISGTGVTGSRDQTVNIRPIRTATSSPVEVLNGAFGVSECFIEKIRNPISRKDEPAIPRMPLPGCAQNDAEHVGQTREGGVSHP